MEAWQAPQILAGAPVQAPAIDDGALYRAVLPLFESGVIPKFSWPSFLGGDTIRRINEQANLHGRQMRAGIRKSSNQHVLGPFRAAFADRKAVIELSACEGNYCGLFGRLSGHGSENLKGRVTNRQCSAWTRPAGVNLGVIRDRSGWPPGRCEVD